MNGLIEHYASKAAAIAGLPGGGHLLLRLLSVDGWAVGETHAFGGGILFIADHPIWGRVELSGGSAAEVAPELLRECLALKAAGPLL